MLLLPWKIGTLELLRARGYCRGRRTTSLSLKTNKKTRVYCSVGGGGVKVARQQHISISKSELLYAITLMFGQDVDHFLLLSSYLDSILHAEHKCILEEMRVDYDLTSSIRNKTTTNPEEEEKEKEEEEEEEEEEGSASSEPPRWNLDSVLENPSFRYIQEFARKTFKTNSHEKECRIGVATRFQRAFMQLLDNAKFEEISAADLLLTSSLNTDYLLTLPINIDWQKASASKAIIFRRGYGTEKQKGLLLVEKLDYLQSEFLLGIFFSLSKPLGRFGLWVSEGLKSTIKGQIPEVWTKRFKLWLEQMPLFQGTDSYEEHMSDDMLGFDQLSEEVLPISLAAQRAVTRYEGILSSVGPRRRLIRRLLTWIGLIDSSPRKVPDLNSDSTSSEPYSSPTFLSRISLRDIWEPATRKFCGNNPWKMLKTSISILFSQSTLQEPAFQELILLYTEEMDKVNAEDEYDVPVFLQLKIYERIPIPDLPVIFPHKKLSFRILDTVRLDVATILGLLAYFVNYKFEDILSSPSAVLLDAIAFSALIISVSRIALGYKQTWDRYQLLVNRILYEKTVASGFGSVHFLLDASGQQQYKEAILAYAILLKVENGQVSCAKLLGDKCERFVYNVFNVKVQMPVDTAVNTLVRLGLAREAVVDGEFGVHAIPCLEANEVLRRRWRGMFGDTF